MSTYQTVPPTPEPRPSIVDSEIFPSLVMGAILLVVWGIAALKGNRKPQLTTARMVNRYDKLNATNEAFKCMHATKQGKCYPSTMWCGTPQYRYKHLPPLTAAKLEVMLHDTMPTVWLPDVGRGALVIGAPGSGKTFSTIDRMLESGFIQGFSTLLYDKKGDQMMTHTSLATMYGYTVQVFAPGEDYSCVINPLDFMRDYRDATTAGELAKIFTGSGSKGGDKNDFFTQTGSMLAKGLMQLAKSSRFPDLAMVYAITQLSNLVKRLDWAVRRQDKLQLDPWIAATIANFLSSKESEKTAASIKTTAEVTFAGFIQNDLLPCMIGKSTIPLYLKPKQLIVFKLDDRRRSVIAPLLVTCMHLCLVENLAEKRKIPFVYSLDEFPSLGRFDKIPEFVNEYRSNGGVPIIGIQSLNQLYELYGDKMGAAIASGLFTHILFGPNDTKTAEEYSKKFGNQTVITTSTSRSRNQGPNGGGSFSTSQQIQQIPLISVDQIERFPQGKTIISSPGYGDDRDTKRPFMTKIRILQQDIDRADEAEKLWESHIEPALTARTEAHRQAQMDESDRGLDLTKLDPLQKQDWTTEQLQLRIKAAELLLPMPPDDED